MNSRETLQRLREHLAVAGLPIEIIKTRLLLGRAYTVQWNTGRVIWQECGNLRDVTAVVENIITIIEREFPCRAR